MIRNFHFKILIGIALFAFVMSFIYLSSGLRNNSDRIGTPIGGLFSAVGLFAAITAGAIRSINRRLDQAGVAEDPEHPTSKAHLTKKNAEQAVSGNRR
jgi:hypothetical protein